jgi:2,4-dienoyl-CoA reductase-like NADH-dependent reductase (Old Yellow Enzyme family)
MTLSRLLTPVTLRPVSLHNRVVISPMCQYSAIEGLANDWHLVHLGRFAQGGLAHAGRKASMRRPRFTARMAIF